MTCIGSIPSTIVLNSVSLGVNEEEVEPRFSGDLISIGTLEPRKNQALLLEVLRVAGSVVTTTGLRWSVTSKIGDTSDERLPSLGLPTS